MLHYLPGCDVEKNHSKEIKKLTDYMIEKGAYIDKCCRMTKKLLKEGDTIVQNCTLCDLLLKETHPENECISIYEYVLEDESFPWADHSGESIIVQDCLRTKDNLALQQAVRECLKKMNYTIIEMPENYDKTRFDGIWIYGMPMQNCIDTAPKAMQHIVDNYVEILPKDEKEERMKEWVKQYPIDNILVYCNGCERGIKLGGKNPKHLVELLAQGLI